MNSNNNKSTPTWEQVKEYMIEAYKYGYIAGRYNYTIVENYENLCEGLYHYVRGDK